MSDSHAHGHTAGSYYVPSHSHYPFTLALGLFALALGAVFNMNGKAPGWAMLPGLAAIVYVIFGWFGDVIRESRSGTFKGWEDRAFRLGMLYFIGSEVMFFAAFFGALFYVRNLAVPDLLGFELLYPHYDGSWPLAGKGPSEAIPAFTPMGAWGLPAMNTALLLSSGVTVTIAHWALLRDNRRWLVLGLAATVLLGAAFMACQAAEYHHAYTELGLTLGSGVYGATFFMLTGFHGLHVTIGAIMLLVVLLRAMRGHFDSKDHFAFEAAAWYWHFVDVVWLGLFVFVYWL